MAALRLRCWLIGADSLLEACAEILLGAGHEVLGVITDSARLRAWARERALAVLDPRSDFESVLATVPFDHLFAITHLERLSERILRLPTRSAINFHDGPLPAYAGLNAPAWALMHGESRHGITWHVMTAALDAGPILKQRAFDIAADETSFSLNAKCFEAAIASFAELERELAASTARPLPQDTRLRRIYQRHRRPAAACLIDWTRSAREIEALIRALDFGRYPNRLGMAKLCFAGRAVLATRARAIEVASTPFQRSHSEASCAVHVPGSVLAIDADGMRVATADGSIVISDCADLSGRALDPRQAAGRLELAPGDVLDGLDAEQSDALTKLDLKMSRAERFWVERLSGLDPIALPIPQVARGAGADTRPIVLEVELPQGLQHSFPQLSLAQLLLAALCAYLARIARRASFDIGYTDPALRQQAAGQAWIAACLPLRVSVDQRQDLGTCALGFAAELGEVCAQGVWLRDVIARYPKLQELRNRPEPLLPVAFELSRHFSLQSSLNGAHCLLEVCDADASGGGACRFSFDAAEVSAANARSLRDGFTALLGSLAARPKLALAQHSMVSAEESHRQRLEWNANEPTVSSAACVHELFEAQVARTPDATALVCGGDSLSYAELDARAQRLAGVLVQQGVGAGVLVGVFLDRSFDMLVAVLGTLKAGGAWVPLDPAHPPERTALLLEDAAVRVILSATRLVQLLPESPAQLILLDVDVPAQSMGPRKVPARPTRPDDLAYAIYTSGSTGRPKGVLVEHRNVTSFFLGMDQRIPHDPPGVWLALTGLSFDISVLELLWPLCRGFKVVVHVGDARGGRATALPLRAMDFSLFYFASEAGGQSEGYRLLLEGARFADSHGFCAVWTPERHFHAFGGLYPNPALTGAAIAAITQRIQIRAGSVVLPLHHPIRVAEDWSLVDNLSAGRVGVSFASGWNPEDFVLAPENLAQAKAVMFRDIEVVRRLWRGETLEFPGPDGAPVAVRTLPRPVQPELPVWITAAGNLATFVEAGKIGANLLTHLLGQRVEQLAPKIKAYRQARADAGFDPASGVVTLMLHTFVGADEARTREVVRGPLERYLDDSLSLAAGSGWAFPTFRRPVGVAEDAQNGIAELEPADRAALLAQACERYYEDSGLFGTPERCLEQVERIRAIEVDEIACLIDFGIAADEVLRSLPLLERVRARAQAFARAEPAPVADSIAELISSQGVTHLQCTPSQARILCADPESRRALGKVQQMFVGGEALPCELARELEDALGGALTNMYGPTESTVWSATFKLEADSAPGLARANASSSVPIGRPIANTRFHVLDECLQQVPSGVAAELFIAGAGVARGYLRRPELEAERFLPEPLCADANARMYRSGDLVRYRADGVLEFLGRIDHQLKVRGHRVEPGEIEAVLLCESGFGRAIAETVVVVREDVPGDQRLVCYLVPRAAAVDTVLLRARLAARLPEYMLPTQFVALEALPRNSNGKIDRRALPLPASRSGEIELQPQGLLESRLCELWRETLALDRVGVEQNFFDLGGHSLLVVRLHRRMHELTDKPVAMTDLFRFPTIRSLARHIAGDGAPATLAAAALRGERRRNSQPMRRQRLVEG